MIFLYSYFLLGFIVGFYNQLCVLQRGWKVTWIFRFIGLLGMIFLWLPILLQYTFNKRLRETMDETAAHYDYQADE